MSANPQNLKPFTKGDPRINRKGRITKKEQFAKMLTELFNEPVTDDKGNPLTFNGETLTRLKARARTALSSRNYKEFELLLHYALGKPKDNLDITTNGKEINQIGVRYIDYRDGIAETEERPGGNSETSGKDKNTVNGEAVG